MRRRLIVIFGAPGAGKSTLAIKLAARLKCPLIDKDFISDVFREENMDAPDHRALAYKVLYSCIPAIWNQTAPSLLKPRL